MENVTEHCAGDRRLRHRDNARLTVIDACIIVADADVIVTDASSS